eukprot:6210291-Pleurochrysis_carterae.AAC.1
MTLSVQPLSPILPSHSVRNVYCFCSPLCDRPSPIAPFAWSRRTRRYSSHDTHASRLLRQPFKSIKSFFLPQLAPDCFSARLFAASACLRQLQYVFCFSGFIYHRHALVIGLHRSLSPMTTDVQREAVHSPLPSSACPYSPHPGPSKPSSYPLSLPLAVVNSFLRPMQRMTMTMTTMTTVTARMRTTRTTRPRSRRAIPSRAPTLPRA